MRSGSSTVRLVSFDASVARAARTGTVPLTSTLHAELGVTLRDCVQEKGEVGPSGIRAPQACLIACSIPRFALPMAFSHPPCAPHVLRPPCFRLAALSEPPSRSDSHLSDWFCVSAVVLVPRCI